MRRPQNLKKSHCFYSIVSKQVGYFFQILWPFQKSWTLNYQMFNTQSLIDSFNYALPILHGFSMNYPLVLSFQIGRGELSFTKVTGVRQ